MQHEYAISTFQGSITLAQATSADIDTVIAILEEAAQWLESRSIHQWRPGSFIEHRHVIARNIADGQVYLAYYEREVIGSVTLQEEDAEVWGRRSDSAVYIHRFVICSAFRGHAWGRLLLQGAEEIAVLAGKDYVRLDCWSGNTALNSYYE